MALYLRDQLLKNLSIDINDVKRLYKAFEGRQLVDLDFVCIIRFDNKGHKINSLDELLEKYGQASKVERLVLTLASRDSLPEHATRIELWLDIMNDKISYLNVQADDQNLVESIYNEIVDLLKKSKSKINSLIRTSLTSLIIQIAGVVIMFLISLAVADAMKARLKIEESFTLSFLFTLIVLSNFWGYFNNWLITLIFSTRTNVQFKKEKSDDMLVRSIVWISSAIGAYLLIELIKVGWSAFRDLLV